MVDLILVPTMSNGGEDIEDLVENIKWWRLWLRKQTEKSNATYKLQIDISEMWCSIKDTMEVKTLKIWLKISSGSICG